MPVVGAAPSLGESAERQRAGKRCGSLRLASRRPPGHVTAPGTRRLRMRTPPAGGCDESRYKGEVLTLTCWGSMARAGSSTPWAVAPGWEAPFWRFWRSLQDCRRRPDGASSLAEPKGNVVAAMHACAKNPPPPTAFEAHHRQGGLSRGRKRGDAYTRVTFSHAPNMARPTAPLPAP